uniref:PPPDE domain-containing protein n=1 Tax=Alexandrium monilatum TaxID=311494 RepID=A0A7S4URJ4_9DINO
MNADFHGLLYTVLSHPQSLRFHRAGLLAYDERLCDGFRAWFSRELLILDASKDPPLRSFLGFLQRSLPGPENGPFARASAAARAVAVALGGSGALVGGESLEERFEHRLKILHLEELWHELPLGRLFGADVPGRSLPGAGLRRHRAVLFKYACDALDICYSALVAKSAGAREADARDEPLNLIWAEGQALTIDCLEDPGRLSVNPALHLYVVREAQCRFGARLAPGRLPRSEPWDGGRTMRPLPEVVPPPPPPPLEEALLPLATALPPPAAATVLPAEAAAAASPGGGEGFRTVPPTNVTLALGEAEVPVAERRSRGTPTSRVEAYVYDITQGWAGSMSELMLGKQVDLIPHTGIVVFGREYYFGSGPCIGDPGKTVPIQVSQVLDLGETQRTQAELEAYIMRELAKEHTAEKYNLLYHNCNHFADAIARFLLNGRGLPRSIVDIAGEALSTPEGQAVRAMIEDMERSARAGQGASTLNPFGDSPAPGQAERARAAAPRSDPV